MQCNGIDVFVLVSFFWIKCNQFGYLPSISSFLKCWKKVPNKTMAQIRISLTRSFKVAVSENNYIHTNFILLTWEYIWKKLKVGYNVEHLFIIILLGTIFEWSSKSCCKEKINEPNTLYIIRTKGLPYATLCRTLRSILTFI